MSLFHRRALAPLDAHIPMDADRVPAFRALVRETFAERGLEVTAHSDRVVDSSGRAFGLHNLAVACARLPARRWRRVVERHVDAVLDGVARHELLSDEQLEAAAFLRLVEAAPVERVDAYRHLDLVADGIARVVAVDLPEAVSMPPERFWEGRGGLDRWRATAHANTRRLVRSLRYAHGLSQGVEHLHSTSYFGASGALFLDELAERYSPYAPGPEGFLVATPHRHRLAYVVLREEIEPLAALTTLAHAAVGGWTTGAGPISPSVFWVRGGEWRQVTSVRGDTVTIDASDPEIARVLRLTRED